MLTTFHLTGRPSRDVLSGCGAMAQLVARLHGMQKVRGSNPLSSTQLQKPGRPSGVETGATRLAFGLGGFLCFRRWCSSRTRPLGANQEAQRLNPVGSPAAERTPRRVLAVKQPFHIAQPAPVSFAELRRHFDRIRDEREQQRRI
jgi:hypothetical protein